MNISTIKQTQHTYPCIPTDLVRRIVGEELAVEMGSKYDATRGLWVFRRNDIRELLATIRCIVLECILLNMPIKILESLHNILPDLSVICGIGCGAIRVNIRCTSGQTYVVAV